ncbi:MAG TPA: glycosyltransferase family 4 protein [Gemmatimonadales bacterium]|nr:glycosyltransferase family 4 protein [Gemmatimonadales bacterium]
MKATPWVVLFVAAAVGWFLTGRARAYALAHAILDRPNDRSSHDTPTPRGGGWGIVLPSLAAVIGVYLTGNLDGRAALGLGVGGVLVALVGWRDDRRGLSATVRGVVHFAAAAWLVAWLGGFPSLDLGGKLVHLGPGGSLLAVLAVAWAINFYNFMDGIDGVAGLEAIMVGVMGGLFLLGDGSEGLALVSLSIAGASAGFLVWNRPRAKIFMGDVGSGLLGFLFAGLALAGERQGHTPALLWLLLLGVFFGDATITLLRRMVRGERWYRAHRSHAYQRLVQAGWSHGRVDLAVQVVNIILSILAFVGWVFRGALPLVLAISVLILLLAYLIAGGGRGRSDSAPE